MLINVAQLVTSKYTFGRPSVMHQALPVGWICATCPCLRHNGAVSSRSSGLWIQYVGCLHENNVSSLIYTVAISKKTPVLHREGRTAMSRDCQKLPIEIL